MFSDVLRSAIARAAPELQAAGITALYLFGSRARDEGHDGSDVDLAFDLADDCRFSLVDQARYQRRLQTLLGRKVDLVSRNGMRPRMRRRVEADMTRVL